MFDLKIEEINRFIQSLLTTHPSSTTIFLLAIFAFLKFAKELLDIIQLVINIYFDYKTKKKELDNLNNIDHKALDLFDKSNEKKILQNVRFYEKKIREHLKIKDTEKSIKITREMQKDPIFIKYYKYYKYYKNILAKNRKNLRN